MPRKKQTAGARVSGLSGERRGGEGWDGRTADDHEGGKRVGAAVVLRPRVLGPVHPLIHLGPGGLARSCGCLFAMVRSFPSRKAVRQAERA